jgi:hypothetical protein
MGNPNKIKFRLVMIVTWIGCALGAGILIYLPKSSFSKKTCILFLLFLVWAATVVLVWNKRPIRYSLLGITAIIMVFLVLPGRNYDTTIMRAACCKELLKYERTHYEWGGENGRGIDCSGLVRRGLINADIRVGIKTLNPRLIRVGLYMWWYDCSAKSLGREYRELTRLLFERPSINAIDKSEIREGDIAVTSSGVHVLAYLGECRWIEADPTVKKVIVVSVPNESNEWFKIPVKIMRWKQLEF